MRHLITAALLAAVAFPAAASAQSAGEVRRSQRELRQEQRDLQEARRFGDRGDVRRERRDVREARQELREDRRDFRRDDWRGYRQSNRSLYARGRYNAPFRYQSFRPGVRIGAPYYQQRYVIADPYRYRLPRPVGYQRWVRHYDDVLLIDTRRGYVVDVLRGFYL